MTYHDSSLSHLKSRLYTLNEIMLGFVLLAYIPWSQRSFNVDVEFSLTFFPRFHISCCCSLPYTGLVSAP